VWPQLRRCLQCYSEASTNVGLSSLFSKCLVKIVSDVVLPIPGFIPSRNAHPSIPRKRASGHPGTCGNPLLATDSGWKPDGVAGTTGLCSQGHGVARSTAPAARYYRSWETPLWFYQTTRRHGPQDSVVRKNCGSSGILHVITAVLLSEFMLFVVVWSARACSWTGRSAHCTGLPYEVRVCAVLVTHSTKRCLGPRGRTRSAQDRNLYGVLLAVQTVCLLISVP